MRKITILTVLAIVLAVGANATVWRVNNTPNVDADFSNLQTAINDASVLPFDTLYVEGSSSGYGDVTNNNKPLILIGAGYFLSENDSTQANNYSSNIAKITFYSNSSGSIIAGFKITKIIIRASNITIMRNYIGRYGYYTGTYNAFEINTDDLDDIIIENNYIFLNNQHGGARAIYSTKSGLNLIIKNNLIQGTSNSSYSQPTDAIYLTGEFNNQYEIRNNVLNGDITSNDGVYINNILIQGEVSGTNNFYNNNISDSTQFGNTNGNQENVDMATVFVDYLSEVDNGLILKAGSPAIGAGYSGEDCGMFGGNRPYILSGMPAIPAIFAIEQTGIGNSSQPIEVNLKAKSHR